MIRFAERMNHLGTETAFEVLARARALEAQGRDMVHLEIGEPDFDTPKNIRDAAERALREGFTHYGPSAGMPEARAAFAQYVQETRATAVTPDQVVITPGAKPIIFFTMLALLDAGDEVIYPNPGFPIYESMVDYVGAKRVPLMLNESSGFQFDIDHLKSLITKRTKLLILNSPHNPTGGVLSHDTVQRLSELAVKHDFYVLSDEIYARIQYEGVPVSPYSFPGMRERTVVLDGHSKTYAMTGWRLGFGVMPPEMALKVSKLQTNSNSCTASFTQIAGIEALRQCRGHDQGIPRAAGHNRRGIE